MAFKIKTFIAQSGERFSQLYDTAIGGFPLFYPTAYCSRNLRIGYAHATQLEYLRSIKKLYEWAGSNKIDLHLKIEAQEFLYPFEIDSLVNFTSLKIVSRDGESISGIKINTCLSTISSYLAWYSEEVITDSNKPEVRVAIEKMTNAIKARKVKQGSTTRQTQRQLAKKLSDDARNELQRLFSNPLQNVGKLAHRAPRFRNVLALRILYDTGMRVGELLSLRLCDFHLATGGDPAILDVRRNHDDAFDDRIRQPVAKTMGRPIPIETSLAELISIYLKDWRSKVPQVGFEDHNFLLVTHIKGTRQGHGLEDSALISGITNLKRQRPALRELHPHLLRHDWNYRFSLKAKNEGYSEAEERAIREFLMGWVPGSASAARYNRRRIQEKAFELGVEIASHVATRGQNSG